MERSTMFLVLILASLGLTQTSNAFIFELFKPSTPMEDMLDMMQQLMTGDSEFDRNFINEIRTCMVTFDPQLPDVHDSYWQGIIDYWETRGNSDDVWGETPSGFAECNATESSYKNMIIYEPCNFASTVSYYKFFTEFCNRRAQGDEFHLPPEYITAFGKVISGLPLTSLFRHVSNTKLGEQQDYGMFSVLEYLLHQGIMEALPYRSTILNELSIEPRAMSSLEVVDAVQKMYSTEPVSNWYDIYDSFDLPKFLIAFIGPLITALYMNFDYNLVKLSIPIIISTFELSSEDQDFFENHYLPELRNALPDVDRKKHFKQNFLGNALGSITKLMYGFVWNEERVFDYPIFLKPISNVIGEASIPTVIRKISSIMNFEYFQPDYQKGVNIYPGEEWCNPKYAHAKWHIITSLSFVDVLHLGDEMHRLLSEA